MHVFLVNAMYVFLGMQCSTCIHRCMMHGCDIGYSMSNQAYGDYTAMGPLMWGPSFDNNPPYRASTSNNTQGWANNHQGMIEFPVGSGRYYWHAVVRARSRPSRIC